MIALVTADGPFDQLGNIMNTYSANYGRVLEANMFDGGASPAMMFDGAIKRKDDPLSSLLLVYEGEACK